MKGIEQKLTDYQPFDTRYTYICIIYLFIYLQLVYQLTSLKHAVIIKKFSHNTYI